MVALQRATNGLHAIAGLVRGAGVSWREFKLALAALYLVHTGQWMAGVMPDDLVQMPEGTIQ